MTINEIAQSVSDKLGGRIATPLIYAQLMHETGGGTSELAQRHHNYAGVTQVEANDLPQPDGSNYYMNFDSDEEFASYFADYLSKYEENGIFNATNTGEYAKALKAGGYFGDTVENYTTGLNRYVGQDSIGEFALPASDIINPQEPIVEQEEIQEATFEDKFYDTVYDSAFFGTLRSLAATRDGVDPDFKITQADIDEVQAALGGDYASTLWVCQNAKSASQLRRLTKMKQEDLERRKRVDNSSVGVSTLGTILGSVIDPINYIPVFGAAGKVGRVARYAKLAAGNAALNVMERGVAEANTGFKQDYTMAALLGAAAGAGIPAVLDMAGLKLSKNKRIVSQLENDYLNAEKTSRNQLLGRKAPNEVAEDVDFIDQLKKAHDGNYAATISDQEVSKHLSPDSGVYVLSKEDAQRIAKTRGIEVPDKAKGIFDDASGISILIKDNLENTEDIRKTILHEKGAHGLKYVLSENDYNKVISELKFMIRENPSPAVKRAVERAENKNDPEEVLGYLAEELKPSNPILRNIKKKLDRSLNLLGVKGRMSEDDFLDILTKSAKYNLENQKGYRVLSDGSTVFHNFRYSEKNAVNPSKLDAAAELNGFTTRVGDSLKRSALLATPYTALSVSLSKTARKFADRFLVNPHMNKTVEVIPVEQQKMYLVGQLQTSLVDYYKARDKAVLQKTPVLGRFSTKLKEDYNRAVIDAYNAVYGKNIAAHIDKDFPADVMEGVAALKKLRDNMIEIMKNTQQIFGEGRNILPEDWEVLDDEFWRFFDDTKRANFVSQFKDPKSAVEWLTKYGIKAAKRNVIRKQMERKVLSEWAQAASKAKEAGQQPPAKPAAFTPEQIEAEVAKQAQEWALGVTDQNVSNRKAHTANSTVNAIDNLDFMKHRFPMDTSLVVKDPWGYDFSFDNDLRSFDFDNIVPLLCNRFAGEVSLGTVFSKQRVKNVNPLGEMESFTDDLKNLRATIESELQAEVNKRQLTSSQMADELHAFDFAMDKLRGVSSMQEPRSRLDALVRSLCTLSYARNGANMGFNQLGEIAGTLAYAGFSAVFDLIPSVGRKITDIRLGKGSEDALNDAVLDLFGTDATRYIWYNTNSTNSIMFQRAGTGSALDKFADRTAGLINTSASFVSTLSGLPKLTAIMLQSARKQTLIDVVKFANGVGDFPAYRNPFSAKKLRAAGITDADAFKEALKPYMVITKNKLAELDVKKLHKENPQLFMRLRTLIDNQTMRCIQQGNIGNTNLLKEKSLFWRVFFQFKDFTMRATHTQTWRIVSNREIDDWFSAGFSMLTNAGVVAALAYMRAEVKFGNNEVKKERYLKDYFSLPSLAYAGFMRSSAGSAFSTGNDLLEIAGISPLPTIRTTVSRYETPNIFDKPELTVGSAVTQLPAIKTALDIGINAFKMGQNVVSNEDYLTQYELKKALELLPAQNNFVMIKLREELVKETQLAKR